MSVKIECVPKLTAQLMMKKWEGRLDALEWFAYTMDAEDLVSVPFPFIKSFIRDLNIIIEGE